MAKGKQAGNKTKQVAAPSNALTSYGVNGNFGGTAYNNARAAGLSDDQISQLAPSSGLKIGEGVNWMLQNRQNYPSFEGGAGAPLAGQQVRSQAYIAPGAFKGGFGPNGNIALMADPYGRSYSEGLQFLNDRFWNPSEAEKKKYYDNYQDDLSGGILKGTTFYTPNFGANKAADYALDSSGYQANSVFGSNNPPSAASAAGTSSPATQAMTKDQKFSAMKGADNYRQALKIAAMNDSTISAKEANAINRQFGVSPDKMVDRLDKINSRQGRKKGLIGLGTSFTNQFADNKLRGQESGFNRMMAGPGGYLSRALSGMNDQVTSLGPNDSGTRTTKGFGKTPKGVSIYGYANGGPLYRQTKGTGGWNYSPKAKGTTATETTSTVNTGTGTGTGTTGTTTATDGPMTPQEMAAASTIPGGQLGGGLGASGANRFRKGRSRINQLGISNNGTGLLSRNIQYGNFFNR